MVETLEHTTVNGIHQADCFRCKREREDWARRVATKRVLFVGGGHDGEWHEVDTRLPIAHLNKRPLLRDIDPVAEQPEVMTTQVIRYAYRRMPWSCCGTGWRDSFGNLPERFERIMYVEVHMKDADVVDALFRGYRKRSLKDFLGRWPT